MRKSDWYGVGVPLIAAPLSILLGSQIGAVLSLIAGIAIVVVGRLQKSEDEDPDQQTLFDGAVPSFQPPPVRAADPRIIPSYQKRVVTWAAEDTDEKLVLANHGGGDAFDVQVEAIDTGSVTACFPKVPVIRSGDAASVVSDLAGVVHGKVTKLPFHDLAAYCEEAAQRGLSTWNCKITYRDFRDNWFETTFILRHTAQYDLELIDFAFSRIARTQD